MPGVGLSALGKNFWAQWGMAARGAPSLSSTVGMGPFAPGRNFWVQGGALLHELQAQKLQVPGWEFWDCGLCVLAALITLSS
jgi:hypothetical protein